MKIMITFNDEEMRSIIDLSRNITMNSEEIKIEDEHIVGRFGEIKFDATKKEMSFDIKTAFINAYSSMILAVINMIKSLASSFEMFTSSWFEDTRDLIAEKKEAERLEKEAKEKEESESNVEAVTE